MTEYIKREDALRAVKHAWAKGIEPSEYIEDIEAADVAPVVQGEWLFGGIEPTGCAVRCSVCGWGVDHADPILWLEYAGHKYCGNCGAMMDGGAGNG